MLISLKNGKTVNVSSEEYYSMTDEEIDAFYEACMADDVGEFINHPFYSLGGGRKDKIVEEEEDEIDKIVRGEHISEDKDLNNN